MKLLGLIRLQFLVEQMLLKARQTVFVQFPAGSCVWAKCQNYPYWPAKIVKVNLDINDKLTYEVSFFGEKSKAFLEPQSIQDFLSNYLANSEGESHSTKRWNAIQSANQYLRAKTLNHNKTLDTAAKKHQQLSLPKKKSLPQFGVQKQTKNVSLSKSKSKKKTTAAAKSKVKVEQQEPCYPIQAVDSPESVPPTLPPASDQPQVINIKTIERKLGLINFLLVNSPYSHGQKICEQSKEVIQNLKQVKPTMLEYFNSKLIELWTITAETMEFYQEYQQQAKMFKIEQVQMMNTVIQLQFQSAKYVNKKYNIFVNAVPGSVEWFKNGVASIMRKDGGMSFVEAKISSDLASDFVSRKDATDFTALMKKFQKNFLHINKQNGAQQLRKTMVSKLMTL